MIRSTPPLPILDSKNYNRIIHQWNDTNRDYLNNKTIDELFCAQAEETPDNIALVYEGKELSYKELNEKSNQLARRIRALYKQKTYQAMAPGTLIGLCLDRSLELMVGMLAILKAGGAYVPIDLAYPQERINYLLDDTNVELILSQNHYGGDNEIQLPSDKMVYIDLSESLYRNESKLNLPLYCHATDLAYVIYTSGTTGRPKGVMVEHHAVINYVNNIGDIFLKGVSSVDFSTNLAFDLSVTTTLCPLLLGRKIFIYSGELRDVNQYVAHLKENRIDFIKGTPSVLSNLPLENFSDFKIKQAFVGGEKLEYFQWAHIAKYVGCLIDEYGPTETTVGATYAIKNHADDQMVIGKPYFNYKAYVLDEDLNPVPVGTLGELYIGGAGVARGYFNNKTLTSHRFINNPFASESDKLKGYTRLFRTGDCVRWLSDGNLEYIGRNDDQVKIRGYRIELGEIETALSSIGGIKQSCVLAKERETGLGKIKYLVGYYISERGLMDQEHVRDQLLQVLPEYMVPSAFVLMDSFPLTVNGKLDKRAFPDPEFGSISDNYVAPVAESQVISCRIWAEVLGLERVGITDDFFRIGGNSILAIQVSHRMNKALGCDFRVADIFRYKSLLQILAHDVGQSQVSIPKTEAKEHVLSFAQERLWFIEQYEGGTNAYHIPLVFELDQATDKGGIEYALQQIVWRHEVLRSTIELGVTQEGIQIVHDRPLSIDTVELREREDYESLIREDINRPFNLQTEYPIRVKFYRIKEEVSRTIVLINTHHIASDGWSTEVFQRELVSYYESYITDNKSFRLPALEIQYKDYAAWQRSYLMGTVLEGQLRYWREKLSDYQTLEFPTDYPRPKLIDYKGSSEYFVLDREVSKRLKNLSRQQGVTLHSVMLSSLSILLSKYTGQEDIVIGSPIANRQYSQTQDLIGFFVNTQVNRILLSKNQRYEDLIQQVHQDQVAAQLHQDLPFEKLVEELKVDRDTSRHPVFQVMFGVQSFGNDKVVASEYKQYFKPYAGSSYDVESFDLSIFIDDSGDELVGYISYATSLFQRDTIVRLINHYSYLLEQLTHTPGKAYSELSLLSPEEYKKIVVEWNHTDREFPKDKTIHEMFQEQVARTPDHIALVYEGEQLSYRELNEKSNQLARYIRAQYKERTRQELLPDTLIALCLDRSLEMVVGILGVLKAGGAYVPIDQTYPRERIDYLLADTKAELILTQRHVQKNGIRLPQDKAICIDLSEALYYQNDISNLSSRCRSTNLAYVIYTSGTTGKPKGVMVEHSCVHNTIDSLSNVYVKTFKATVHTPYVFDVSVSEIFASLLNGLELHILTNDIRIDVEALSEYFLDKDINVAYLPPVLLSKLPQKKYPSLKNIVYAGEPCDKQTAKRWSAITKLFNYYGPTETSIYATGKQIQLGEVEQIGRPIQNTQAYVLDRWKNPVPVGVIGELYIGGAGVARGYLNNSSLTDERFIINPFARDSDKAHGYTKFYKTGDLVRWLSDGNLEYIGRNDDQVKIRGYRIELGEIETVLSSIGGIKQSCVLARERETDSGKIKYLVGYYISERGLVDQKHVREKLSAVLPDYMVPDALVELEQFPLTINGKLNKRALPDPEFGSLLDNYVAPVTESQVISCRIWAEVLGLERVGITDDFFRIGGNSILAIQVSHRMSKSLGFQVKVADLFRYRTVEQLLTQSIGQPQITIPARAVKRSVLSFAQERLWFIEQYEEGTNAYHMPNVFELDSQTDASGVEYALQQIVSRHEVLRSTIELGQEQRGVQVVHDDPLLIEEVELPSAAGLDDLLKGDINRPFNLQTEYPIRVKFYRIKEEVSRTIVLINTHHIASDGWSTEVFQRELVSYYESYITDNKSFRLPALEIQYKDYAAWQKIYLKGEILESQLSYWKNKLSGYQLLELPTDYARPHQKDYRGSSQSFRINRSTSDRLRNLAKQHGVTLHSVMLSSINILLGKYTGQDDIVVGSPIANRQHIQTQGLIGFFVNMLVNRTVLQKAQSYEALIQQVHQDQTAAQLHQDLPFEKLVDELEVERDTSRHPIFQVSFVVQSFGKKSEIQKYLKVFQGNSLHEIERFDLGFFVDDSEEELTGHLSYATSLFHRDTIGRLIDHYAHLLDQLVESPGRPYSEFSLLRPEEYNQILYQWNDTDSEYPKDKTIAELFRTQSEETPNNIALVCERDALSYKQLNEKSNQLAHYIRARYKQKTHHDLAPDTLIGLCLDRSLEMVIGMLAVLKAGGAYVPIDPTYPQERIDYLLADTNAELILSQNHLHESRQLQLSSDKVIHIDLTESLYRTESKSDLPSHSRATDLAYVIYTSGTTGKPKGVMVEQRSVNNEILSQLATIPLKSLDASLLTANIIFDASAECIYMSLLSGGSLHIPKNNLLLDSDSMSKYIEDFKISVLNTTPSYLKSLEIDLTSPTIKHIILGGEAYQQIESTAIIYNTYGPTETTIVSCAGRILLNEDIHIGKPLRNTKAYVLDQSYLPVPIGVIGELYIGGAGVSRGYLNNEELSLERFINNPYASEKDKRNGYTRMYKTGDLVRWLPSGNLQYIGRNDDQVKIRGYRIEPGEVEYALNQIPGIRQSCVLAQIKETEIGVSKHLVGYYILNHNYHFENDSGVLDSWRSLYDTDYQKPVPLEEIESDFSGWNSYITGGPIPLQEMEIWRTNILDTIINLEPRKVLEIGVGSGLLMYPLLNHIQYYVGLDISPAVIDRHKKRLKDRGFTIGLYPLKADQLNELPKDELYDTIIVNSVCQYFPSIAYFNDMLEKALGRLSDSGSIFIGDLRNYDLHKELIKEKLNYQGGLCTQHVVDRITLKENELLISPRYFLDIGTRYGDLIIDVIKRDWSISNELSKFRYDVIITKRKQLLTSDSVVGMNSFGEVVAPHRSSQMYNVPFLSQLGKETIIKQLLQVLPEYMVPSAFVLMDSFPLTVNGKLDKRAFPDPEFGSISDNYVAPVAESQVISCRIWAEVLGLERVGITDDFFRIGGNSILAIQVLHRMNKALGCDFRVADIFRYKSLLQILAHDVGQSQVSIPKTEAKEHVLSFAQERLWFIEQYEGGTNAYHIPLVFELDQATDKGGIEYALQQIVWRHEILRSTIELGVTQEGIQIVHDRPLSIDTVELREREDYESLIREDINRPFNLQTEYPIRVKFYRIKEEVSRTIVLINTHHIASDGWSTEVFQRELVSYYESYITDNKSFRLPALEIQYKDYAAWQKIYLKGEILESQLSYWKNKLSGYQLLELPTDYARPHQKDYRGSSQSFRINRSTSDRLRNLAKQHGVTLHSVMLSSINILLGKYTGQDDIVVGSPIANRQHIQTQGLIGFFVNMLVNRTVLQKAQSYEALIQQVHQDQTAAQLHQDLPFEKLVDELEVERDTSRHPIFQVSFVVQSFGKKSEIQKYLKVFQGNSLHEIERFDLGFFVDDSEEELTGHLSYATSLFHRDTIGRLIDHYAHLLDQLVESPGRPYSEFSLLRPEEYNQILYQWNDTDSEYPKDKTIAELFRTQSEETPNNIALVCERDALSYKQLNEKSNQLAHYIRARYKQKTHHDLAPDTLIGLCLDRSLEMVIGMLAVLKAGGAYVPIDPTYPQERIDYLLADTNAELILSQNHLHESRQLQLSSDKVIHIDLTESLYRTESKSDLPSHSRATDLAYVIYTSGTTGKPKGVMVEQRSVVNLIDDLHRKYRIEPLEKFLLFANYVFDASVEQTFLSLLSGGILFVVDNQLIQRADDFVDFILRNQITHLHATPSYLDSIDPEKLSTLKRVVFGAEYLPKDLFSKYKRNISVIINEYGPTETAITSLVSINSHLLRNVNIQNIKTYVLNQTLDPVPVGVIGELYIGGAGVARGYLNNSSLTDERFIINPFARDSDKAHGYTKFYKTGDLVRWLSDGNLEYIGRNDDQVKIRGYRIELGEIETVLSSIGGIKQSCVLARERETDSGKIKYLVGYYISERGLVDQKHVREKLSAVLPDYMVPDALVELEQFPLTINGKLNKRALPDPEFGSLLDNYVAPVTESQVISCRIWAEVLGLERVGITDDFFRIGGNSILAIQVSHRMTNALGYEVRVSDVFASKCIDSVLKNIRLSKVGDEGIEWEF